jgi:hypothetical protein
MKKKYAIILGLVSLSSIIAGVLFLVYSKPKPKPKPNVKPPIVPNNTKPNIKPNSIGKIDNTGSQSQTTKKPDVDKTKKQFGQMNKEFEKIKEFLSIYKKKGFSLLDTTTNGTTSKDATKAAYFMITKELIQLKNDVQNDKTLTDDEKLVLKKTIDSFFDTYLTTYFDSSYYKPTNEWYVEMYKNIQ